ncbi:MAG TPA: SCO family protein, partial [Patescibacteria group bacterium]|nr:SCO family protein [Patescibacteria group bacterium]
PDLQFSLTDDSGKPATEAAFKGKIVLLYFGFTQCPDQCPLTMGKLNGVLKKLGPQVDQAHVLFVSVDPKHDQPKELKNFISAFDPTHMTGFTGSEKQIENIAKRYRIGYEARQDGVVHSNAVFIFDREGHARLLFESDAKDDAIIHDLRQLLS